MKLIGTTMIENQLTIIDSHTGGEPTRTIVSGGPDLGSGTMAERLAVFRDKFDHIRSALVNEPRGSEVMVGALYCEPADPANAAGVIFFNNVGYLGMCGHGTIGLAVTLYHLGKIELGIHTFETPVGPVEVNLTSPFDVSFDNVPSYRLAKDVSVDVEGIGIVTGDIAWSGNWFFLIKHHGQALLANNTDKLIDYTCRVRNALEANQISGAGGQPIDHVELFGDASDPSVADSRNFVLCPGSAYDRSPCGTGTSSKLACLYADGLLVPGDKWRQESIIGSVFEGSVRIKNDNIIPRISGQAFVNLQAQVIINPNDPYRFGIVN